MQIETKKDVVTVEKQITLLSIARDLHPEMTEALIIEQKCPGDIFGQISKFDCIDDADCKGCWQTTVDETDETLLRISGYQEKYGITDEQDGWPQEATERPMQPWEERIMQRFLERR